MQVPADNDALENCEFPTEMQCEQEGDFLPFQCVTH